MPTAIVEEYLEAIYKLRSPGKTLGASEVGRALGVSPASATEMIKRLARDGLATRTRKGGVDLSEGGEREALLLIRKHRISERFLVDVLGVAWKDAHEEACRLEHALSAEVESKMETLLASPETCPHGNPIPDRSGVVPERNARPLSTLKRDQRGVIAMVSDERRDILEYLATLGMMPGKMVLVEETAPFSGPLLVCVNGARYALGREVAEKIWIEGR